MLDLVTNDGLNVKTRGDAVWAVHDDLRNTSLYSEYAKIRRVPVEAIIPNYEPDGTETHQPEPMKGFHALYNTATGHILNVRPVGASYNLVPHDILFSKQAELMGTSNLPTGNIQVIDRLHEGGLRAHRTVLFNDLVRDVGRDGDAVRCRMDIFNSVDMSWAFQVFSGAYRDLCRNTQVFGGQKAYHQKRRHTANLSPEALIGKASMGLGMWNDNCALMDRMTEVSLDERTFARILADTLCKKTGAAQDAGQGSQVNERLLNYLLHRFREEKPELGSTMWAAYNALTHWSTHVREEYEDEDGKVQRMGKKDSKEHMVRRVRGDKVRDVIESPAWTELLAA